MHSLWLTIIVFFSPTVCHAAEMNAGDWVLNIGGALRMSYNEEDCDGACQDLWRTTDTHTTAYEDSDNYLTGDISQVSISGSPPDGKRHERGFQDRMAYRHAGRRR